MPKKRVTRGKKKEREATESRGHAKGRGKFQLRVHAKGRLMQIVTRLTKLDTARGKGLAEIKTKTSSSQRWQETNR